MFYFTRGRPLLGALQVSRRGRLCRMRLRPIQLVPVLPALDIRRGHGRNREAGCTDENSGKSSETYGQAEKTRTGIRS